MYFRKVKFSRGISFFMFLCLFLSTGGLFYASLIQSEYHYEKEHLLSANVRLVLTNSAYKQAQYRKDELKINGRWFDVKKTVQSQGKVIVYGHFDFAEFGIQALLKVLLPTRESATSRFAAPIVFNFYYQSDYDVAGFFITPRNLNFSSKLFAVPSGFSPIFIKPPAILG